MSETPKDAKGIFLAALDIQDAAKRAEFVERSCGGDAALRQRVEDLLRAYGQPSGPLENMAAALAPTHIAEPIREQVGSTIGPYKLMEQIGEGGFGLVFVAEQERPIRRKVALKIIKPGMDSRDVIARFEAERQALALMDHPNIARVLDAGTTDSGRPYFVMELVRGIPITDYCDKNQLTTRERLELFIPVCNAIQHAHLKGIIHRDIKPSNVLVTMHDGKPVVKVIDFGVAKALHQSLTDRTIYTRFAQMIGTPLYMSPEQAEMSGLDIDTRTDVYSLGVLLYELLTGTTPLDKKRLAKAAYDELLKIIREEDPPKPSVRLSQSTDTLPSIAAQRKTEPAKLSKMFSGDLDWIAMKALEKDRTRRYETANAFAADVLRYLNDEPVEASPPSAAYRLRKFARKHRRPVLALVTIGLVLVLGIAGTTWGLVRARQAEHAATASEQKTIDALGQMTKERDAKEIAMKEKQRALTAEEAQRNQAERELVNGLLRPIGLRTETLDTGQLVTPSELRSFVDWSAIRDSRLKSRVLEVALENPDTAMRVARGAERAIQACIGLSPTRRDWATKLVVAKQRDLATDPRIRIAACWLALELGDVNPNAFKESLSYLSDSKNALTDEFAEFVQFAASRIGESECESLLTLLETTTADNTQSAICWALPRLIERMRPEQIKRAADDIVAKLRSSSTLDPSTDSRLAIDGALTALAPHLEPRQVAVAVERLPTLIEGSASLDEPISLWKALAPKLGPEDHRRLWNLLVSSAKGNRVLRQDADLRDLASRLSPGDVDHLWDALFSLAKRAADQMKYDGASELMLALIPRVQTTKAKLASGPLIAMFEKSPRNSARSLTLLGPHLDPAEAERAWDAGLVAALACEDKEDNPAEIIGQALVAIAPRLERGRLDHACSSAISALKQAKQNSTKRIVLLALAVVSSRLDPAVAKSVWEALLQVAWDESDTAFYTVTINRSAQRRDWKIGWIAELENNGISPFSELARRLPASQLSAEAHSLIAQLDHPSLLRIQAVAAVVPDMEPSLIPRAADELIAIGTSSKNLEVLAAVDKGLIALAPRLDHLYAERSWNCLAMQMRAGRCPVTDGPLELKGSPPAKRMLGAFAVRLEPKRVETILDESLDALQSPGDSNAQNAAVESLIIFAPSMHSRAARAAKILNSLLGGATDGIDWNIAVKGLLALNRQPGLPDEGRLATAATAAFLDLCSSDSGSDPGEWALEVIRCVPARSLAKLLSHPGCVGELRARMLERFEEIIYYKSEPVFGKHEQIDGKSPSPKPLRTRRFNNLHDVANWIQQNWPDFDLETNCPATWRGSR
jgi:serine/threonine protein kinase